jgi:hypothetical protein
MEVTISTSNVVNSVTVSASTPGVAHVQPIVPMVIELQLFRDGQDGKDSYEIALLNGYVGTKEQWIQDLLPQTIDGGLIF